MGLLMLCADEVASQLEDPFFLLPLEDMARRSVNDIRRSKLENRELAELASRGLAGSLGGANTVTARQGGSSLKHVDVNVADTDAAANGCILGCLAC